MPGSNETNNLFAIHRQIQRDLQQERIHAILECRRFIKRWRETHGLPDPEQEEEEK